MMAKVSSYASELVLIGLWLLISIDISHVSQAATLDKQPKVVPSSTAAPRRPNLIERTSDAIYRALLGSQPETRTTTTTTITTTIRPTSTTSSSGNSSADVRPTLQPHLDLTSFRDEPHSAATQTSATTSTSSSERAKAKTPTTKVPTTKIKVSTTTKGPTRTSTAAVDSTKAMTNHERERTTSPSAKPYEHLSGDDGRLINAQENSLEYFSFLNRTSKSIYAINELTYLNRTTRLAHESENSDTGGATVSLLPATSNSDKSFTGEREGGPDEAASFLSNTSEQNKQAQKLQQQVAPTRDEIMLLCKLLHKQLENGSIVSANGTFLSSNGTNLLSPPTGSSQKQQRTTSTSTTPKPRDLLREFLSNGLHISDQQNDLNDTQDDHLLESVFSLEKRAANELSYEEVAQRVLHDIFNAGFRRKFAQQLNISTSSDQANSDDSSPLARSEQRIAPIRLKSWSRTITGGRGGRLKLIYWLVMPASDALPPSFKVLEFDEANDLLEELDHTFIKQTIDNVFLVRPLVLVAPFKRDVRSNEAPNSVPNEDSMPPSPSPNVLDDLLPANEPKSKATPKTSGLKDFIDRLFTAPFEENLQIYLILLIILLFLIVMCFTIPMICCESCSLFRRRSESSAALTASSTAGRFTGQPAPAENNQSSFDHHPDRATKHNGRRSRARNGGKRGLKHQAAKEELSVSYENGQKPVSSISGVLKLPAYVGRRRSDEDSLQDYANFDPARTSGTINEAVWTRLSNSTTTLTKDRTRLMHDDGRVDVPIIRQRQSDEHQLLARDAPNEERMKRFEWYTFEDKTTTRREFNQDSGRRDKQSQTLTDHMKMTKSVQTSAEDGQVRRPSDERLLNMSFSDRLETRNSDTLTKSELVMLKEKLIPIGGQQLARSPAPDSQISPEADNDEVRELPSRSSHDYVNQATRHIDSSIDDSTNGLSKSLAKSLKLTAPPAPPPGSSAGREDQRTAKMRFLELPGKAQSKMEAIKGELARLEARESEANSGRQAASGVSSTYQRYDII